jgi:hypothetical protein
MKFILLNISLFLLSQNSYSQTNIRPTDLKRVIGIGKEASHTYYKSNKPYTMPANLIVTQEKNEKSLKLKNIYPNEPRANSSDKIKITK